MDVVWDPQRKKVAVDLKGPTRRTDRPALKTIGCRDPDLCWAWEAAFIRMDLI